VTPSRNATGPQSVVVDGARIDWGRELRRRFIGASPLMEEIRALLSKVAPTDSPVLIRGESGTGKEVAARAIHDMSPRGGGRFVPVNCAAIPESLVESELFGYEKGAFTGAVARKIGLIEAANGGTLFLDEVTELPIATQAKLLRVLQEQEIQRLGGIELVPVEVRVLAAGNRDLDEMIEAGEFRQDLFYRLNVIRVTMPTLRDRIDDLDELAKRFMARMAARRGTAAPTLADETLARMRAYSWPGNVRELENVIERMVILADSTTLTPELLPDEIAMGEERMLPSQLPRTPIPTKFRQAKEQFERRYLIDLLRKAGGSVTAASQISGVSRRNLYDKIEKLGIDLELFKGRGGRGPG
jgi:DNA-binding NtrC family response regulator